MNAAGTLPGAQVWQLLAAAHEDVKPYLDLDGAQP
jgi:hypothetical protein